MKLYSLILLFLLSSFGNHNNHPYNVALATAKTNVYTQDDFKVYSNPNSTRAIITFQSATEGKGLITLFYSDGRLIKKEQVNVNKGSNTWEYKLPRSSIGVYLVEFKMGNIHRSGKIFKSGKKA